MKIVACLFIALILCQITQAKDKCKYCIKIVNELDKYLTEHPGETDKAKEYVCVAFSHGNPILNEVCRQLFKRAIAEIIKGIERKDGAEKICQTIHYCPKDSISPDVTTTQQPL
uniref:Saposin B-type domain-containing protein n=1 Tax=Rhabditophanes sp. KR3021 TaxID=114890 RepID=A0AC35TLG9_9BILA